MSEPKNLTLREVRERLRCSESFVFKLLRQKKLTRIKQGRKTLVPRADVERIERRGC